MARRLCAFGVLAVLLFGCVSTAQSLTPEQKQTVAALREDLENVTQDIEQATKEDATYSGGLIKTLIAVRLEVLKTNAALIEQRINAIESGARTTVVIATTKPDPARAAELGKDVEIQRTKAADARREADRYSGGLVQAMSEATYATATNTLAMLEQQYFVAKYGLATPSALEVTPQQSAKADLAIPKVQAPPQPGTKPRDCLRSKRSTRAS